MLEGYTIAAFPFDRLKTGYEALLLYKAMKLSFDARTWLI